jgi:hypothetical protein
VKAAPSGKWPIHKGRQAADIRRRARGTGCVRGSESGGRQDHSSDRRHPEDPLGIGRRGKSGVARAIYYYHNASMPVFLLAVYAKNEKANLSKAERISMKRMVSILVATYPGRNWRRK